MVINNLNNPIINLCITNNHHSKAIFHSNPTYNHPYQVLPLYKFIKVTTLNVSFSIDVGYQPPQPGYFQQQTNQQPPAYEQVFQGYPPDEGTAKIPYPGQEPPPAGFKL